MKIRFFFLGLVLAGCSADSGNSDLFTLGKSVGKVDKELEEASGLVASISHTGYFWTHNDSGNNAEVFLIDDKANVAATYTLANTQNRDWEDITMATLDGKDYLYIGEIGDNNAAYPLKMLYRFEEPIATTGKHTINQFDTLYIQLPDGSRDTEALMFDPVSTDMFLISKREDSVRLYEFSSRWNSGDTLIPAKKLTMPFHNVVAADISLDGKEVILKTYDYVYYWKREKAEPIVELLKQKPQELKYKPEVQGESVAWSRDGSGYYTLSESNQHERASLLFYKRN